MGPFAEDIARRASEYASIHSLVLKGRLGFGKDGSVWRTGANTALKVFRIDAPFQREKAAYTRLMEREIVEINGFAVPQMLFADANLLAIDMTIVSRPFVLDFGSTYLDGEAPEFPEEVMEEWLAEKREEFGENWPRAAGVVSAHARMGIHLMDVHPGNIGFE